MFSAVTSGAAVQGAFRALETSAGDLAMSQLSDIEEAVGELRSAISDIPDTGTVDQALISLEHERPGRSAGPPSRSSVGDRTASRRLTPDRRSTSPAATPDPLLEVPAEQDREGPRVVSVASIARRTRPPKWPKRGPSSHR